MVEPGSPHGPCGNEAAARPVTSTLDAMGPAKQKFLVSVFVFVSAIACAIAFGGQRAWWPALKEWDCEELNRPPFPSVHESIMSAGAIDWIYGFAIPLVLVKMFFGVTWTTKSLFFWVPALCIHFYLRFSMIEASKLHWGFCGLRDGLELNVFADFIYLGLTVALAVFTKETATIVATWKKKTTNNDH